MSTRNWDGKAIAWHPVFLIPVGLVLILGVVMHQVALEWPVLERRLVFGVSLLLFFGSLALGHYGSRWLGRRRQA